MLLVLIVLIDRLTGVGLLNSYMGFCEKDALLPNKKIHIGSKGVIDSKNHATCAISCTDVYKLIKVG